MKAIIRRQEAGLGIYVVICEDGTKITCEDINKAKIAYDKITKGL